MAQQVLSLQAFRAIFPIARVEFLDEMNNFFIAYGITTKFAMAGFLCQVGIETGGFTKFRESLWYSSEATLANGPYAAFKPGGAYYAVRGQYVQNEEALANVVYMDPKKGLGNTQPGDGWKFRGRGLLQMTGRAFYDEFAKFKKCSIDQIVNYMETSLTGMVESGFFVWHYKGMGKYNGDVRKQTQRINPAFHKLAERKELYNSILRVLNGQPPTVVISNKMSSSSDAWVLLGGKAGATNASKTTTTPIVQGSGTPQLLPASSQAVGSSRSVTTLQHARDSNKMKGSRINVKGRIKLADNLYRHQFACSCGCGSNTVDVSLTVVLSNFQRKTGRVIQVVRGVVCTNNGKNLGGCDQGMQHAQGKAADIMVPADPSMGRGAMSSAEIVRTFEQLYGSLVFCYAMNPAVAHIDVGNF